MYILEVMESKMSPERVAVNGNVSHKQKVGKSNQNLDKNAVDELYRAKLVDKAFQINLYACQNVAWVRSFRLQNASKKISELL